jgi:formylglycine-generating enzyme required for sulfatase activity
MGDGFGEGYPQDGEGPVHEVVLGPFRIDRTPVTNDRFARFVDATGYVTEAERFGDAAVFHSLVAAAEGDVLGASSAAPWWRLVRGADWRHPAGPRSDLDGLGDHPVVQVSWNDAVAYCAWSGRRLPTEAEWEYAARGGLRAARYPWGDEPLGPTGDHLCNTWQGDFPTENTAADGYVATSPVASFPSNGFGLHDVAGNVWDWCADWFSPHSHGAAVRAADGGPVLDPRGPRVGAARVMRGGSYLCHASYCHRYRVAARSFNTPDSASGNCGFRTVDGAAGR